jgi:hypothetical protein
MHTGSKWPRFIAAALFTLILFSNAGLAFGQESSPTPLAGKEQPVNWWFVFKFNTKSFPGCPRDAERVCRFGGEAQEYPKGFGQQYAFSSDMHPALQTGGGCLGDTTIDPVGATFDAIYKRKYYYVIWNDQFYNDPELAACRHKSFCDSPWAHSKGMLAWDEDGNGVVMQVSTPNWPGSGSKEFPRGNGNTLGCLTNVDGKPQDNVLVSQHFFATKLNKDDVIHVLDALQIASVVTQPHADVGSPSAIVRNGGPSEIQQRVNKLGKLSEAMQLLDVTLSNGVELIAKPPLLHVPAWQMVSAVLGKANLTVATWLTGGHQILDTKPGKPECWDASLGPAGSVSNAEEGHWKNVRFGLRGAVSPDRNHAKIGVSTTGDYAIFGDLNQEGALSEPCDVPQNTRGGLFYIVRNDGLAEGLRSLMSDIGPDSRLRASAKRRHIKVLVGHSKQSAVEP